MQKLVQFLNRGLMLALLLYLAGFACFVWRIGAYPDAAPNEETADGIVVLTGGEERVDRGLALLQDGGAGRALISGVHPSVRRAELLALHRVPPAIAPRIDLGFGAVDTAGNAEETARWAADHALHRLIVVTSTYHMPRALLHLRGALPADVTLRPLAVTPAVLAGKGWYRDPKAMTLLTLAYNKYLLTWPEILIWHCKR